MNKSLFVFAFSVALCASPATWAAPRVVALLPSSGDNVDPTILRATRDLLKEHLQRSGAYTVLEPSGGPLAEEPTPAQAAKQASALGAEQAIALRLIHFGTSARVRLSAISAKPKPAFERQSGSRPNSPRLTPTWDSYSINWAC